MGSKQAEFSRPGLISLLDAFWQLLPGEQPGGLSFAEREERKGTAEC